MQSSVYLDEILTAQLLADHREHIGDFLEMEGITPVDPLGRTPVHERAAKELLAELAHDLDQQNEA